MTSKIIAIARKDVQIFTADRKAMIVSFIVPIAIASFFCLIMGGAGSGSAPATKLKTLVVMEDKSEVSKLILADLKKSDSIEVVPSTRKEATDKVTKGEASVAVIFPAKFGDDAASALFAGTKPKLEILYDPTKSTEKQIVNGALMQTMMSRISQAGMTGTNATASLEAAKAFDKDPERRAAWQSMINSLEKINSPTDQPGAADMKGFQQPFEIKEKSLSASTDKDAEQKSTRAHIFAGMAVQGILFFGIDAAMSILRERRTGIWARLRAAPVNMNSLLLGRLLGSWLIALLIMLGVFAFGFLVMGVRVQGSWFGFGLIA
ncbi:MAG: ABC transporter permease, partial [Fimbriimonadaceae bacterium]